MEIHDLKPSFLAWVLTLACLCAFALLAIFDIRRAFNKRANWLPGNALVLSALTIQALSFVCGTNISLLQEQYHDDAYSAFTDYVDQSMVTDVGTLNIIIFLGYFLPAMVARGSVQKLAAIAAFTIGIFFPVKFFFAGDNKNEGSLARDNLYVQLIQLPCIVFLILLLGCTVLAGKTVRRIMRQRISAVLMETNEDFGGLTKEESQDGATMWNVFEDELFKSWIVARLSQPDYIIARSVLSSSAGLVVTSWFILFKLLHNWHRLSNVASSPYPIFVGFVLVGMVVICWRWLSALLYFPWHAAHFSWRRCFWVEDFWTRSVVDMIHKYDVKNKQCGYTATSCFSYGGIVTKLRLHKLLHLLRLLQISIVLISKFFWLLSQMVLGMPMRFCWLLTERVFRKFMRRCLKHAGRLDGVRHTSEKYVYEAYSTRIEPICMPGEDPLELWKANRSAINQIAFVVKKGSENGRQCGITNSFFTSFSMEWVIEGFELLDKLREAALPQVVRYFPSLEKQCWKMTVVSFIAIVMELDPMKSDRATNAVKVCSQAWDLLKFVDSIDCHHQEDEMNLGDSFDAEIDEVSMAADKEFFRLERLYEKLPKVTQNSAQHIIIEEVVKNLSEAPEALLKKKKLLVGMEENGKSDTDSKDCMEIAPSYHMYKICKVIEAELEIDREKDLMAWTERSLRNLIACCLSKMPDMLAKHCRKCAEGFEEDKIWEAIYLAGKARGMMESWGLQLVQQRSNSIMQWTLQVPPSPADNKFGNSFGNQMC